MTSQEEERTRETKRGIPNPSERRREESEN